MASVWGRSKGPKFYAGSKHDSPWNKDLLWKLCVTTENKLLDLDPDEANVPPFFAPGRAAAARAAEIRDAQRRARDDKTRSIIEETRRSSAESHAASTPILSPIRAPSSRPKSSREAFAMDDEAAASDAGEAATASSAASARPHTGHRLPSLSSGGPAVSGEVDRVAALEHMLRQEARLREQLQRKLEREQFARERVEGALHSVEATVAVSTDEQRRTRERTEKKLRAYQDMMHSLVTAFEKRQHREERAEMVSRSLSRTAHGGRSPTTLPSVHLGRPTLPKYGAT